MKKAVLLVNLGTPDSFEVKDVKKYLKQFLSDRRVIEAPLWLWQPILRGFILPFRSPKTAKLYTQIWRQDNQSPLLYYTQSQAQKLQQKLEKQYTVTYAMRYGAPSIQAQIEYLCQEGVQEITILPLYPQYSATTTATVYDEVYRLLTKMRHQPTIVGVKPYYNHCAYIDLIIQQITEYVARVSQKPDVILMSFHGIPQQCVDKGDPYYQQCCETYELVKKQLKIHSSIPLELSFQSRFGPKEWLQPYTTDKLGAYAKSNKKHVVVLAPGFACDCLETLEELAKTEKESFLANGGLSYHVLPCFNDEDKHINLLSQLIS